MKNFKKILLIGLFLPSIVSAKTISCTSTSNYTVGKNVYDGAKISCNSGSAQIFAISELNKGYVTNPYNAVEGKSYFMDIVWTGTIDTSTDKIIVDGNDQTDMAFYCESGCHLSSKSVKAASATTTTTTTTTTKKTNEESTTTTKSQTNSTTTKKVSSTTTTTTKKSTSYYWVTFDSNGANETIDKQLIEENKSVVKPKNPTKDGYTFAGWYLNNKEYDFSSKITKNITLKAKWNEDVTNKTNISFVNLTGILAPFEGELLDTSVNITTYIPWTIDIFNLNIKWFRGKDINNINEEVTSANKHKVEAGYYYKLVITLMPGNGYTLDNTKVTLNGKNISYKKDESNLILKEQVYGPIKKGESAAPILEIEDYNDTVGAGDKTEFGVYAKILDHDNDADSVLLSSGCLKITNTTDFSISSGVCPDGSTTITNYSKVYDSGQIKPLATLTLKKAVAGRTYTTDIILTDTKGRTYTATYTLKAVDYSKITLGNQGDSIIAEFLGEAMKKWYVHTEELIDKDMGKEAQKNLFIDSLGALISIQNINITSEDGEKKNGSFTIKILLNEEMKKYKKFTFVYVVGGDGYKMGAGPELIEGHVEGNYLVARLPHLSTYAIIGNNDENKNNIGLYIGIVGVVVLTISGTILFIKKKKN